MIDEPKVGVLPQPTYMAATRSSKGRSGTATAGALADKKENPETLKPAKGLASTVSHRLQLFPNMMIDNSLFASSLNVLLMPLENYHLIFAGWTNWRSRSVDQRCWNQTTNIDWWYIYSSSAKDYLSWLYFSVHIAFFHCKKISTVNLHSTV